LTDTDYGLTVVDQCEVDGWTLLQSAKTQAIAELKSDLRAAIRERYDSAVLPFSGIIAKLTSSAALSVSKPYTGVRIRARKQKGAKFVIKKIYLGLNASGTFEIYVTSNDPLFEFNGQVFATVVANQFGEADFPDGCIELPLHSRACEDQYMEYYLSIERGAAKPRNNKITCCGNVPAWKAHIDVSGFEADDNIGTGGRFSSAAHGFAIDGYLACDELDWVCEAEELGGYHLKDVLARSIQFRGAAIAISGLIDTLQVSPCSGYQLESLNSKRKYLNQRYQDNIAWVSQNIPGGITECFTCKPKRMFHRSSQLV
jgi:hypothetical protein